VKISQRQIRKIVREACLAADQFADGVSIPTRNVSVSRQEHDELTANTEASLSDSALAGSLSEDGTYVDERILSMIYTALLRVARLVQGRTMSGDYESNALEVDVGPPTSEDAWHPSDVTPLEDAWSGGDNVEEPLDFAMFETGESNSGPHVSLASRVSESREVSRSQLRSMINREMYAILEQDNQGEESGEKKGEEEEYLSVPDIGVDEPDADIDQTVATDKAIETADKNKDCQPGSSSAQCNQDKEQAKALQKQTG